MHKSKMVIVIFPRKKRLTKEQLARHGAINGIMSLMSVGGEIKLGKLVFDLSNDPTIKGIPQGWFTGDSHFRVELMRILSVKDYNTLYHWCTQEGIPVFRGEEDGEGTMMVIGPCWEKKIDEVFTMAILSDKAVRPYAPKPKNSEDI